MKFAVTATPDRLQFAPILLHGPLEVSFSEAAALGYDAVDLHLHRARDVEAEFLLGLCEKHRLQVSTPGTGMITVEDGLTFADASEGVRRRALQCVLEDIALASRLGSAITIGLLSGRVGRNSREAATRRAAFMACLRECAGAAADAGVTVLLEPLNRYECDHVNRLEDGLHTIEELDSPSGVKLLGDTFHMNLEEANIGESLRRAGAHLGYVHLSDSNREAPGHGHLDIPEVLRALRDISYDGYVSFEVLPYPDARSAAVDAISTVRDLMKNA